ncbi:unnamed protein product, partial [Gadus morhua 'NCC']
QTGPKAPVCRLTSVLRCPVTLQAQLMEKLAELHNVSTTPTIPTCSLWTVWIHVLRACPHGGPPGAVGVIAGGMLGGSDHQRPCKPFQVCREGMQINHFILSEEATQQKVVMVTQRAVGLSAAPGPHADLQNRVRILRCRGSAVDKLVLCISLISPGSNALNSAIWG